VMGCFLSLKRHITFAARPRAARSWLRPGRPPPLPMAAAPPHDRRSSWEGGRSAPSPHGRRQAAATSHGLPTARIRPPGRRPDAMAMAMAGQGIDVPCAIESGHRRLLRAAVDL
jgi:hypothetical protein